MSEKRKQELINDTVLPYSEKAPTSKEVHNAKENENIYNLKKEYDSHLIDRNLVVHFEPNSFETEQFKILRTNLFYSRSKKIP